MAIGRLNNQRWVVDTDFVQQCYEMWVKKKGNSAVEEFEWDCRDG